MEVAPSKIKKGYKQTEVGVIPEEWEVCELSEAVDFLDGLRRPVKSSDRAKIKGIYPYYGASGIVDYVDDYIFDDDLILLGEDGENILSRNLPLAFQVHGKIWVNNHAHVLKPKSTFVIKYLTDFLENLDYSLLNSGTAQPKLNKRACMQIKVVKPEIPEQQAIATALSDTDELIQSLDALIEKKKNIKTATMQQLLSGKTRLTGFKGEWKIVTVGTVVDFAHGRGLPKSDIREGAERKCIHYGQLFTEYSEKVGEIRSRTDATDNVFLSKSNDVLIPTSDVTPRGLATASCIKEDGVILGGGILVLRPKADIDGCFISYFVTNNKNTVLKLVKGSTVFHLYAKDLSQLEVYIPPTVEEQTAIVTVLEEMSLEINLLRKQRDKLNSLKQGMMHELLAGNTRLV